MYVRQITCILSRWSAVAQLSKFPFISDGTGQGKPPLSSTAKFVALFRHNLFQFRTFPSHLRLRQKLEFPSANPDDSGKRWERSLSRHRSYVASWSGSAGYTQEI